MLIMRFLVAILITIIVCKCKTSELSYETTTELENNERTTELENSERTTELENNETLQMDNNCSTLNTALSNLEFTGSFEELKITWHGISISEICDYYQYRIKIAQLPLTNRNIIINKKINTTYYVIRKLQPCTKYKIVVDLLENNNAVPLGSLNATHETESIAFNQIEKLNISTTTSAIWLSWKAHKYAKVCNIRYIITANKEIPYFRYVNRTDHWIKNLHSCTEYNVSVTPSSRLRSKFDDNSTPYLMHLISTLPENVNNLNLEVRNNISKITWLPPDNNKCIKEYKIIVNGNISETTNNTYLDRSGNLYCTEIKIEPVDIHNASGKTISRTKPGLIKNLHTITTDTSITAIWEEPENSECVSDYSVKLTGTDTNLSNDTILLFHTFHNLKACSKFEIMVAARSFDNTLGEYTPQPNSTSEPTEIEPVTLTVNEMLVTWQHPSNVGACDVTYILRLVDDDGNEVFTDNTTETSLLIGFDSWIGCMDYTLSITPTLPQSQGTPTEERKTVPRTPSQPICIKKEVDKTFAVLECTLDSYETNMCDINKIFINCEASIDDNEGSWVIWNVDVTQDIIDNPDRDPVRVKIENISEFTNYTCHAIVANSAGNSSPSEPVTIQTEEGVPDAPKLVNITEPTNRILYIQWTKPETIPGNLQNYYVTIKSNGAKYFIPTNQSCKRKEEKLYEYRVEPSENEFYFSEAFPKYEYEIYVHASTNAGYGPISEIKKQLTNPGIPEEPANISYNINKTVTIKDYDANVTLTWMFPCYTNGVIKHFEIDVFGYPYADLEKENDTRNTINVPINENKEDLDYEYIIKDLFPAFNYTIDIKTVIEEDLENKRPITFFSPESYPEAPAFKPITEVENNSFILEWNAPAQKNGHILCYNLIIKTEGPLYWVPDDCNKKNATDEFKILPNERSFKFENATPYHNYSAYISAFTSVGEGSISEMLLTQTLPSEPEPVRDLIIKSTNSTGEVYNAQVLLSFKHPCNIYGSFKSFTVNLHGVKSNLSHIESKIETDKKDEYDLSFNLKAEYHYHLTVQVETESDSTKTTVKEGFTSPPGVPPIVTKDIQEPVLHESTQASFTFDCDLFDEQDGTIQYYAIILGENNHEEKSLYGFWDGTDDTWPPVDNNRKETQIQPYQATPNYWNPFIEADCHNYTFVLGDGSTEFNKPLQDGVTYTLKVRGLTNFGYRDSPTIIFLIPAITNLALILGLVFGLLGTGLLMGFIFILWRKRKQWEMKKESIKSIPLTPIPVSIKQFSEYYDELKTNSDKLKQEFTLLGSKSNQLIQSTNDGVLAENKKKNRYTNIIPYDETRVKLMDTNDNHSITDYINASYIMGYSGTMEYIATQGPLEHTCMDFWKMVIQENSSLIVMVAQFVEQNKDKCYKYFPNNHENIELENGIAIRCCTELDFKTHIIRTLLIQKDLQQWTVTHLQFTDWPDFGCPIGTEVILEFCQIMREHAERNSDPIIIHCSAGVGRTGTLIALDIVLQAISYKRDIDIFGTVLNLRRDRKNMVQTEKQYLYIHSCIKNAIENPPPIQCDMSKEPVYENLNDIKRSQSDNNIKESIF